MYSDEYRTVINNMSDRNTGSLAQILHMSDIMSGNTEKLFTALQVLCQLPLSKWGKNCW